MTQTRKNFVSETHYFKRELAPREVRSLFGIVDEEINTKTELEQPRSATFGRWMHGFISKKYADGVACALMDFGISVGPAVPRTYMAVTLRAETPYKKRRELTERLDAQVEEVLESYFMRE
jgi:hypothetical protein